MTSELCLVALSRSAADVLHSMGSHFPCVELLAFSLGFCAEYEVFESWLSLRNYQQVGSSGCGLCPLVVCILLEHSINENLLFPSLTSEDKLRMDKLYSSITFLLKDIAVSQF